MDALAGFQTPCLLVDLAAVRANVAAMLRMLDGDVARWRPHVKTCKVPEVLDVLLAAGVTHFKCATTREAAVLLGRQSAGIDLLVAMAHRGANLARVATLAEAFPGHRVALLTESPEHAAEVRAASARLGLFVDLDPDWGRSGIPLDDHERIAATVRAAGDALRGLHCYEGHLRADAATRRAACTALYGRLLDVADRLALDPSLELCTSGTPAFPFALEDPRLRARRHRVGPGTVVYWDTTSASYGIEGFRPAVHVLATVISSPRPGRVTCDAGSKALDAACGDPCAAVESAPHLVARTPSEEHLPLDCTGTGPAPRPGDRLRLVPRHVCPAVNLADEAVLLDGERVLGVVPVRARGHEVDGTR
ncbi:MAG TPA: alanine racemase [Planctomycetota bacterium]|nr:alanine racemase [Planctomycetota bacterium]